MPINFLLLVLKHQVEYWMNKIEYKEKTTLENCDEEPIHTPGAIQSFGGLLVIDKETNQVHFCSENIEKFTGESPQTWLKKNLDFATKFFTTNLLVQKSFTFNNQLVTVKNEDKFIFLTFEPQDVDFDQEQYFQYSQSFIKQVNLADDFASFSELVAADIKDLTGYDRVMIYRFDPDFNGTVIAEAKEQHMEPFLGLNYPHTDIPAQARALYKKNPLRILVDVNEAPIPIFSNNEKADYSNLDLTNCIARSVSPIHIQYLKNMGVGATLTISILIDQQLWGLVSCHHNGPKFIGNKTRQAAQLQTDLYASQINKWERSDEYLKVQEKEHIYQSIIEDAVKNNDLFSSITKTSYLTALTSSDGCVVKRGNDLYHFGQTPENGLVFTIDRYMKEKNEQVFLTNELQNYIPEAGAVNKLCSGLLFYRLDLESESAVFWFRKQLSEGAKWGGDPQKSVVKDNGKLAPRNSFKEWEENVTGKSAKWLSYEIQAGLRLCAFLEREIYIKNLKRQKERFKVLTQELQNKNEELSQFNWISSHDMKEPLRKIRLFVDQIQSNDHKLSETHQLYFSRIDASAARMQTLIDDLLSYSGLSKEEAFSTFEINKPIEKAFQNLELDAVDFKLTGEKNQKVKAIYFQLVQLFSNLLSNANKFKHPDRKLKIEVDISEIEDKKLKIDVKDNGIGFDPTYNDQIFQVFQRLHQRSEYEGTGIGLAICKKIVEKHNGEIRAFGKVGEGAKFEILFPFSKSKIR